MKLKMRRSNRNLTGLRNRVNELGVAEPLVQRLGSSRIVIELPGVSRQLRSETNPRQIRHA